MRFVFSRSSVNFWAAVEIVAKLPEKMSLRIRYLASAYMTPKVAAANPAAAVVTVHGQDS